MIVTTAGRTNDEMIEQAKRVATDLQFRYVQRNKLSVHTLIERYHEPVIVVGKERMEVFTEVNQDPFFFHPNSAMFRMKRLRNGKHDPFIDACGLIQGMSLLDCTLGLGSDSIVASYVVGKTGIVTGIEMNKIIYYLVKTGLLSWDTNDIEMNNALRSIHAVNDNSLTFLRSCPDHSYDVVYFDPMFEETIDESNGISGMKSFAYYDELTLNIINEAKRVARKRVVLKDHFKSSRFEKFQFQVMKRKTALFHYGFIQLDK